MMLQALPKTVGEACTGAGELAAVGNFPPDPDVELIRLPTPPTKKPEESYKRYGDDLNAWIGTQKDFSKVQFVKIPMQPFCDQELSGFNNCANTYLYTTKDGLLNLISEMIKNDLIPSGVPDLKSLGAVVQQDICLLGKVLAYCQEKVDDMLPKIVSLSGLERGVCN